MRKTFYRGKRIDDGEWVEGSYVYAHKWFITGEAGHFIYDIYGKHKFLCDPKTISAYIDLIDKFAFEGDIVIAKVGLDTYTGIVKYDEKRAMYYVETFERGKAEHTDKLCIGCEYITACIGNKWDNPELLKGSAV